MEETKLWCYMCQEHHPIDCFGNNKSKKSGKNTFCLPCGRKRAREWALKNPESRKRNNAKARDKATGLGKSREYMLRYKYGLSPQDYTGKLVAQNHCCVICKVHVQDNGRDLCVDHCHASGKVRDLLCNTCNAGLGQFKDRPELLRKAADYLEEHHARNQVGGPRQGETSDVSPTEA